MLGDGAGLDVVGSVVGVGVGVLEDELAGGLDVAPEPAVDPPPELLLAPLPGCAPRDVAAPVAVLPAVLPPAAPVSVGPPAIAPTLLPGDGVMVRPAGAV